MTGSETTHSRVPSSFAANGQDFFNYFSQYGISDFQIQLMLQIDGRLDADRLHRAIRLSADAEPILGCRFVEDAQHPYWERRQDLDRLPWLTIRELPVAEFDTALHEWFSAPIHMQNDPMVKVCLLRTETNDAIGIKMNHTCCDGAGLKQYMELLARIYTELELNAAYVPEPNVRGKRDQSQLFLDAGIMDYRQAWDQNQAEIQPSRAFPYNAAEASISRKQCIRRLSKELTQIVFDQAAKWEATVNDVILASYYRALHAILAPEQGEPITLTMTADLRKYLAEHSPTALCNLSGSLILSLRAEVVQPFSDLVKEIAAITREYKKTNQLGLHTASMFEFLAGMGFNEAKQLILNLAEGSRQQGTFSSTLSNFGKINAEASPFGCLTVSDAYMVSPAMHAPGFMLGASSCKDVLTLTVSYFEPTTDASLVEKFMDLVMAMA
ncbi:condensation domain-containing protein [Paenibacillus sp. SI8]|uniref:condensation domain-containing protein n=1 Tax=unclassified Paenibacillus TaxID=185978 RepID=UPI003466C2C4